MEKENQSNRLIVRLGTEADQPEIDALRIRNNPRVLRARVTQKRPAFEHDATLVVILPSGELAASILLGAALSAQDVKRQLGVSTPVDVKDGPILTTTQSCSLEDAPYLDLLRYIAIHTAQHTMVNGRFFAWHVSAQSQRQPQSQDEKFLESLGYQIRKADSLVASQLTMALPRERFRSAYATLFCSPMNRLIPPFDFKGRQPFQECAEHVAMT